MTTDPGTRPARSYPNPGTPVRRNSELAQPALSNVEDADTTPESHERLHGSRTTRGSADATSVAVYPSRLKAAPAAAGIFGSG